MSSPPVFLHRRRETSLGVGWPILRIRATAHHAKSSHLVQPRPFDSGIRNRLSAAFDNVADAETMLLVSGRTHRDPQVALQYEDVASVRVLDLVERSVQPDPGLHSLDPSGEAGGHSSQALLRAAARFLEGDLATTFFGLTKKVVEELADDLYKQTKAKAEAEGRTVSEVAREALERYVGG